MLPVGPPFDVSGVEERLRQLEVRMTIAERSGRTLWEETMRNQTELRLALLLLLLSCLFVFKVYRANQNRKYSIHEQTIV